MTLSSPNYFEVAPCAIQFNYHYRLDFDYSGQAALRLICDGQSYVSANAALYGENHSSMHHYFVTGAVATDVISRPS